METEGGLGQRLPTKLFLAIYFYLYKETKQLHNDNIIQYLEHKIDLDRFLKVQLLIFS